MTKPITITIFEAQQYDSNDWPPSDPEGFLQWFRAKILLIPSEYRATAHVGLSADVEYDSSYVSINISYSRPETDEEAGERIQKHREWASLKRTETLAYLRYLEQEEDK